MILILALDGLEYELVEKFNCRFLKQKFRGKTDISEFSQPRTVVLWASFLTGRNMEKEILAAKQIWETQIPVGKTFLMAFAKRRTIDMPAFSYEKNKHHQQRLLLKRYLATGNESIREDYNRSAFDLYSRKKLALTNNLERDWDILVMYFSIADTIGHLNFGTTMMMRLVYGDLDRMVAIAKETHKGKLLILSDHGMKAMGPYGDHSKYGFWSTNFKPLGSPKITDFAGILTGLRK